MAKSIFNLARMCEQCYTAKILHSITMTKIFLFLLFLKSVFKKVQRGNKIFGSENNSTKLLQDLLHLIESCSSKIVIPGTKITSDIVIKNHLIPHPYLGYQFELEIIKSNLFVEDDKNIYSYCIDFLLLLLK